MARHPLRIRVTRRQRKLSLAVGLLAILLLVPTWLSVRTFVLPHGPARFYFSTPYTQVLSGQNFSVDLRVTTGGHTVNAVESTVQLDPKMLEITGITTDTSFCTLYTANSFDPVLGTVRIACGTPHPGFTGDSLVVTIRLRAKASGDATISVAKDDASVLADDGKGTELLGAIPTYQLSVKQGSY